MTKVGNGGKGIAWNTEHEVENLGELNYRVTEEGVSQGPAADRDRHRRREVILMLAPETNGEVAVKAWEALSARSPAASTRIWRAGKEDEKIRFRDIQAQPRKIISCADLVAASSPSTSATTPATPTSTS